MKKSWTKFSECCKPLQVEILRTNINELKEVIEEKDSELAEIFPALKGVRINT